MPVGDVTGGARPVIGVMTGGPRSGKSRQETPRDVFGRGDRRQRPLLDLFLALARQARGLRRHRTRFAGFIPVDADDVKFAGGVDKLVVGLPSKGLLQRWDLATLQRELTVQAGSGTLKHVALGYASQARSLSTPLTPPARARSGRSSWI